MKYRIKFTPLAALALTACATGPEITPQTYRDPTAQIASQTNVTAGDLAGTWIIRERFESQTGPQSALFIAADPNGTLTLQSCVDPACQTRADPVAFTPAGPGRWAPTAPQPQDATEDLWVMWMDYDGRTAAIGTPPGTFGWIMDRSPTGGTDRIIAARDIMAWFGYDIANLAEPAR